MEEILQKTLVEAKDRPGFAVLDDTVAKTMTQVMEIRESLLDRIKMIRKEEIYVDPDQNIRQEEMLADFRMSVMEILLKLVDRQAATTEHLKEISQDLLRFKIALGNEVMRILMLPEKTSGPVRPDRDQSCFQCASLKDISNIVENLVECAKKEEPEDGEDVTNDYDAGDAAPVVEAGEAGDGDTPAPGTDCVPPQMYAMDLISANEIIDKEITEHYGKIVIAKEDEERKKLFADLGSFKQLRDSIDEVITKLMDEASNADADAKLKKTVQRGLAKTGNELKDKVTDCQKEFCPNDCESCAAEILVEAKDKMEFFKESTLSGSDDEASKRDSIRTDLIKYITDTGNEARKILISKASGPISACETEKLETYKSLKSPMWMVVNTTIFSDIAMVEEMVDAMIANLKEMIDARCGSDTIIVKVNNALNCEWEEYEETKNYLEIVDGIIQKNLFKAPEDAEAEQAKIEALLGFVDIQAAFDKRVKALFEANLECPEEARQIKQEYM